MLRLTSSFLYKKFKALEITLIISMKSVILTKSKKTTNLPKSLMKKGLWQSSHYKKPEKPHKH